MGLAEASTHPTHHQGCDLAVGWVEHRSRREAHQSSRHFLLDLKCRIQCVSGRVSRSRRTASIRSAPSRTSCGRAGRSSKLPAHVRTQSNCPDEALARSYHHPDPGGRSMRDSKMLLLLAAAVVLIPGVCGRGNGNLLDDPSFEVSKSKDQFGLVFGMVQHALRRNDLWLHTLGAGVGSSGGWPVHRRHVARCLRVRRG